MWIQYVSESRTKSTWGHPEGRRRFVIGAEKTTGEGFDKRVSFTTLDPWKASLCIQARDQHLKLAVKYRDTLYFDADLLWVGRLTEQASA